MPLWKSIKQWRAHLPSLPHADSERLRQGAKQQVIFCVYNLEAIDDSRGYNKCDTAQKYGRWAVNHTCRLSDQLM